MTTTLQNLSTQPYGTQREACLVGTFDADGWLVDNPMPRAVFAFQIDGALDPGRFTAALHRSAALVDAWRARLRKTANGFVLIGGVGEASEPVAVTMTSVCDRPPEERPAAMRAILEGVLYSPWDLRREPQARVGVVEIQPDVHVTLVAVDHAACDGVSLAAFLRRALALYAGLPGDGGPSMMAFASRTLNDPARAAARQFWSAQMAQPIGVPKFPGGRVKPWSERVGGEVVYAALDGAALAAFDHARRRIGARRASLFVAAMGFVVELWAERPVPIVYARAGRSYPGAERVEGPLLEVVSTVAPTGRPPATISAWMRERSDAEGHSPPLYGQWLSDFGGVEALRERRLIVVNSLAPVMIERVTIGGARLGPADISILSSLRVPAGHTGLPSYNGLHMFMRWTETAVNAAIFHDRDVLPSTQPVIATLERLFLMMASEPDAAPASIADRLRRDWDQPPD
ncbi:MAG TPA: condensation domain-containing protein [Kofleriaceae bacterium]|nr:condensation domain-containing protein [Kofleriaceae bacterium]